MIESVRLFLPELFLAGAALLLLVVDVAAEKKLKFWTLSLAIVSLLITLVWVAAAPVQGRAFGVVVSDSLASFFKILALAGGVFVLLLSENDSTLMGKHAGSYAFLVLLSVLGTLFLASSEDFLMAFISLELTTLPLFILAGYERRDLRSSESAIKFFLVGAFSTAVTLYGISLLYGVCGSTHFGAIAGYFTAQNGAQNPLFFVGVLLVLAGLAFKMTLVPFHQWTPDTYEGAPTPITAFFSLSREAGVVVVLLRFFGEFVPSPAAGLTELFAVVSILTMTVGNLTALRQDNLKRLLAYSSIAHAGTLFIGIVSGSALGREAVMLYSVAYTFMSLGAFAVVIAVSRVRNSDDIGSVRGLAKDHLFLALLMAVFLLSLAGIPPTLGFWGKFYVFLAAIESRMYWLVAIGLLNSVIAVYYYLRIVHKMFFEEPDAAFPPAGAPSRPAGSEWSLRVTVLVSAFILLVWGVFPNQILGWIRASAQLLP